MNPAGISTDSGGVSFALGIEVTSVNTINWEIIKLFATITIYLFQTTPCLKIVDPGIVLVLQNTGHTATCNCGLTKSTLMLVANRASILYNTH